MKAVKTGRRVYGNLSPRSPCAGKKSSNPVNLHFQPKSLGHVNFSMVFTDRISETLVVFREIWFFLMILLKQLVITSLSKISESFFTEVLNEQLILNGAP